MALVGDISGSIESNSTIGISGTVIVANRPNATFPSLPGVDVSFFVSGSSGSMGTADRGTAAFGGDVVISGSLQIGTGTILITTDYIQLGTGSHKIGKAAADLMFYDDNIPGGVALSALVGGGGGGDDFFDSATAGSIFTTGSAAFVDQEAVTSPSDKGTDVFFYVSGSISSKDGPTPGVALFGGDLVVSGSMFGVGDALEVTGTISATKGFSGSLTTLTDGSPYLVAGPNITINTASNGSVEITGSAGGGPSYFSSTTTGSIFTSGSAAFVGGLDEWGVIDSPADKGTDTFFYVSGAIGSKDGATPGVALFGGDLVVSGSMFAEGDVFEMTGTLTVTQGISGSLTTLADGSPYLVAGPNITINTASNGSVEITGSAAGGPSYFESTTAGSIFTTGSAAFVDQEAVDSPLNKGDDVFFYVSGSIDSLGGPAPGVALFGGDVRVSGSLLVGTGSVKVTSNDVQFGDFSNRIELLGTDLHIRANKLMIDDNRVEMTGSVAITGSLELTGSFSMQGDILEVTGTIIATSGLSGSLTSLSDGSPYLIAGPFITINTASNGSVEVTGSMASTFFESSTAGSIFTTGSTAFIGQEPSVDSPTDKGTDVFFYVSGSQGSKDGVTPGVALFGGDVVISGTLHGGSPLKVSGSMQVSGSFAQGFGSLAIGANSHAAGGAVAGCFGYLSSVTSGLIVIDSSYGDVTSQFSGYDYALVDDTDYGGPIGNGVYRIASVAFNSPSTEITLVDPITTTTANVGIEYLPIPVGADKILGNYSHAEGAGWAQGLWSHAEGFSTATGYNSHAESNGTASGQDSHAEGVSYARGQNSHAEGDNTEAMGDASHAGGLRTIASGSAQTAVGKYNLRDNNFSLLVVGNGTGNLNADRSDVFRVNQATVEATGSLFQRNGAGGFVGFMGNDAGSPEQFGTDVFFFASGSQGSKDGATPGVALFGGDLVVSGAMFGVGDRLEVTGSIAATEGLSGSLTTLVDGTSYLIAGTNISITSQSNGSITIDNTFVQADDYFDSTTAGSIFTTGSAAFVGQEPSVDSPADKGTDVFFYVSGSRESMGGPTAGTALFGGDVRISGSLTVGTGSVTLTSNDIQFGTSATRIEKTNANDIAVMASKLIVPNGSLEVTGTVMSTLGFSGSLTRLTDGTSYLIAGQNISIATGSNGAVTISNTFVQVDDYFDSTTAGSIFTTGSAAFIGQEPSVDSPADKGADVFFYVSGSLDGTNRSLFGGDVVVSGSVDVKGSTILGDATGDNVTFNARVNSNVLPSGDMAYNLGSESSRWANVYTGDLHLRNDRGNWTVIEEEEYLTIRNNKTGKMFRLVMEPIDDAK